MCECGGPPFVCLLIYARRQVKKVNLYYAAALTGKPVG